MTSVVDPSELAGVPASSSSFPAEARDIHTRILRCMLAADDCYAYWRNVDVRVPPQERLKVAFEDRWFGTKTEARVRTLLGDMFERFDAFPEALDLLHRLPRVSPGMRTLICHFHIQLADPIYRAFAGNFLAQRREEERRTIDRAMVARWVEHVAPGRWSPVTTMKFAANLLATACDAGVVRGKRDPRELPHLMPPELFLGYAFYVLRHVRFEGDLVNNPYVASVGLRIDNLHRVAPRIPGVRVEQLGKATQVTFLESSLSVWGDRYLSGDA